MFVRLESENLREQAIVKARGLGGKRHPENNHKYFVSTVLCEATRATQERNSNKLQKAHQDNKNKPDNQKQSVYIRGTHVYIGGQKQRDFIEPPTPDQVDSAMATEFKALEDLQMYQSTGPLKENGSEFMAYAVRTRTMDKVWMGYVRAFYTQPSAAHVMMAYRVGKHSGSCDDEEHRGGGTILKQILAKNFKNVAVYVTHISNGQQIGNKRFDLIKQITNELLDFLLVNSVVDGPNAPPLHTARTARNSQDSASASD